MSARSDGGSIVSKMKQQAQIRFHLKGAVVDRTMLIRVNLLTFMASHKDNSDLSFAGDINGSGIKGLGTQ